MTLSPQRLDKAAEAARRDVDYDHPARRFLEPHEWTGIARAAISAYLGDDAVVMLPSRIDFEKEARDLKISIAENSYPAADGTADIDNHAIPIITVTLRNLFERATLSASLTERDAG